MATMHQVNHGLRGRFAPKPRAKWPAMLVATLALVGLSVGMGVMLAVGY
jgi:hypothetical protein